MLNTTVGQLLINEALPHDMRNYSRVMDGDNSRKVFQEIAERHPEDYRDILFRLANLGREAAYISGGYSFGPEHLRPAAATIIAKQQLREQVRHILADKALTPEQRRTKLIHAAQTIGNKLTGDVYKESLAEDNPLAYQVLSGSRGNANNLRSLRGFDAAYEDHEGNIIGMPIMRNYSEGLSPAEYFASTFGARKGLFDTKVSVARSGYFAKQMTQIMHRLLVTGDDDENDPDNKNIRGLPVSVDDNESTGALLAIPHGPYKRNTIISPKVLHDLKHAGYKNILIRSPTVGGPDDGGVYAKDAGIRERGWFAPLGDYIGIAAAQAASEKLTQGALSSKHSGGVAGAGPTGFQLINQLVQVPEAFKGGATHAQLDGYVSGIKDAPQGGKYITVNNVDHYVPPDMKITVKPNDEVEAGDVMTNGLPDPSEIVKYKGIGEGRRYLTTALRKAYADSNFGAHRRNIELMARGLINHVRVTDLWNNYAPDDVIPYHTVEHNWSPRAGTQITTPKSAVGKYLEVPTLHYTIGTKIRKSMLPTLNDFGVTTLSVHNDPPPFEPEMERAATSIASDPDWQTRMIGSGQKGNLLDAVHRGDISDTKGTSYVPALVEGIHFGKEGPTKGWQT